ncbi:hypothetical protein FIBSPDRAFT_1036010 [Athelia psychrophila]|uniref:ZZ-type domain-containing protein n=1 Tax=Athelia psychrophila TaxID=1759441 RepID=A0A166W6R9_9AGAM|nr:hypothetical protein FIBSPDRAFT_1036010 [Fibularhizoctonia sp. CBS 109695]
MEEFGNGSVDRTPHAIQCGHIFCGSCVHSFDPKRCPMCRTPIVIITKLRTEVVDQPLRPTSSPNPANREHPAHCDMCSTNPIRGERYKCLDCPDYDTCSACFCLTEEYHPGHSFIKIRDPSDHIIRSLSAEPEAHHAVCDNCKKTVLGERYKCAECPDYDHCAGCEALPIPKHPPAHVMLKIKSQGSYASFRASKSNGTGSTANIKEDGDAFSRAIKRSKRLLEEELHRGVRPNHQLQARRRNALDDLIAAFSHEQAGSPIGLQPVEPETTPHRRERQPIEAEHTPHGTDLPDVPRHIDGLNPNPPARPSRLRKYASKLGNLIHV